MAPHCSQRRTGAAGEIDDRNRSLPNKGAGHRIEHRGIARGDIVRFAQC
jgi:hypothetical protein